MVESVEDCSDCVRGGREFLKWLKISIKIKCQELFGNLFVLSPVFLLSFRNDNPTAITEIGCASYIIQPKVGRPNIDFLY